MSLFNNPLSKTSTQATKLEGKIDLTDNTKSQDELPSDVDLADIDPDDIPILLSKTTSRLPTPGKLRQEIARRKYAKYSEDKYNSDALNGPSEPQSSGGGTPTRTTTKTGDDAVEVGERKTNVERVESRFRRGQQKVKGLLDYRRKTRSVRDRDTEIDVLYENQRGSWLFGQPLYSSKSLLNFDPSAWTTASNIPSSVNITNAQLPDPSWEWVWKTWYVDMSLDVDELGWQYSFMFQNRYPWHGTHPWLYSFVRRRRWIRKRARRQRDDVLSTTEGDEGKKYAPTHKLNADYFSVRAMGQAKDNDSSFNNSNMDSLGADRVEPADEEVDAMPTLLQRLRKATVDREKIILVLQYMEQGGEDTHYLADEVPRIMSMLMFQHSRRHLLVSMLEHLEHREKNEGLTTSKSQEGKGKQNETADATKAKQSQSGDGEPDAEREKRKTENLHRAVEAADGQIKQLEYWSDLREATEKGESLGAAEEHLRAGGPVDK